MSNTLIDNIIGNYAEQYRICEEMATLANKQLDLLKDSNQVGAFSQVMDVVNQRQALLASLQQLDLENRNLQEQVLAELGLDDFTLSQLQNRLDSEQYTNFKEILNKLGIILKSISETDYENQLLMREGLSPVNKKISRAKKHDACSAYKQVMNLNKDNR